MLRAFSNSGTLCRASAIRTALTCAAVVVGGCMVGPDYYGISVDAPSEFIEARETYRAAVAEPARLAEWWRTFEDPALDDLVLRAIEDNLDLQLAEARVREARAARGIVASEWLPTVDAEGGFLRSRRSENTAADGPFGGGTSNLWEGGFDASWELDVFGRVGRGVQAADADIEAAEDARRDVLVTLLAEVVRNYVELRGFQRRIELAQRNATLQADTLRLTESRYRGGLTSELDVASAAAQLSTTEAAIPLLRSGSTAAAARLGVLLGVRPEELLAERWSSGSIPTGPAAIDPGAPEAMIFRRPDLRSAERRVAAQSARVGVATADLYPRISLIGFAGIAAEDFTDLFNASSSVLSFGPTISWRVFDGGRIKSDIEVQDARLEQARLDYRQAVLEALEEVEVALAQHRNDQEAGARLAESVRANQRRVELALTRYERGIGDFLDVIEAQRSLTLSEDELARRQQEIAKDVAALYKALGGV
jgi:NodT family efflux transporter outer membrane factor (OMF) lipoprotein